MTTCARGCRSFGKHPTTGHLCTCLPVAAPPVLGPCRLTCATEKGECTGCQPRPAVPGTRLCGTDLDQLDAWLADASTVGSIAWARVWLRLCYREGPWRSVDLVGTPGKADPPAPSSLAVLDAHAMLAAQLAAIVQGLCAQLRLRGPDDGAPTDRVARWLHGHAYDLADTPFITTAWTGLHRVLAHAHQIAPWRPERVIHHGIPCPNPDCRETGGLTSIPGENAVTCDTCGTAMTRDDFDRWVKIGNAHYRPRGQAWRNPTTWDTDYRQPRTPITGDPYPPTQNRGSAALASEDLERNHGHPHPA